jgi:Family of unknown function (DUF6186)
MTTRDATLLGYALIAAVGVTLELLAWWGATCIAPLGRTLGRVMRTRAGRVGVIAGWAWFGLHLFAR